MKITHLCVSGLDMRISCHLFLPLLLLPVSVRGLDQNQFLPEEIVKKGEIRYVESIVITDEAMSGEDQFGVVSDIAIDDSGRIYACDYQAGNVKIFGPDGSYVKTFGRPGQGPGDLHGPRGVAYANGRIFVIEQMNRRISVFNTELRFIRFIAMSQDGGEWFRIRALPNGQLIVQKERTEYLENAVIKDLSLELYSNDIEFIKVLYRKEYQTRSIVSSPRRTIIPIPYAPDVYWDITADGRLVVGYSGKYEVMIIDPSLEETFLFSHPFNPVKVRQADKEKYFSGLTTTYGTSPANLVTTKNVPDSVIKGTSFPSHFPAFRRILVDPFGNICIFPYYQPEDAPVSFDMFSSKGSILGRIRIAGESFVPYRHVPDKQAFWTIRLNNDEYKIVKYEIRH